MVPQGWAGPKEAEPLHAELNAVPEMQHWPGGNDMGPRAPPPAVSRAECPLAFHPALPTMLANLTMLEAQPMVVNQVRGVATMAAAASGAPDLFTTRWTLCPPP